VVAANKLEIFFDRTQEITLQKAYDMNIGSASALFAIRERPRDKIIMIGVVWSGTDAKEVERILR
jgi:hypothetical protein